MSPESFKRLKKAIFANHLGWFDVLQKSGTFDRWLASTDQADFDYALWLLGQPEIIAQRAEQVVFFIRKTLARVEQNASFAVRQSNLLRIFTHGDTLENSDMFRLFWELLNRGKFDQGHPAWTWRFDNLPQKNPEAALDLLVFAFDRYILPAAEGDPKPEMPPEAFKLSGKFINGCVRIAPEAFVNKLLPKVAALIQTSEIRDEDGYVSDSVWPWLSLNMHHDFKDRVLYGLNDALSLLAKEASEKLDRYIEPYRIFPHRNLAFLFLSAWSQDGESFAEKIANYLLADPHRFNVGYGIWGTGNGNAALSRKALMVASPHFTENCLRLIESSIMRFYPRYEQEHPKSMGYTQMLLLHAIDSKRLGPEARLRLLELDRKFPGADLSSPTGMSGGGVVGSPIPQDAAKKMTDDQWVSAMKKYPQRDRFTRARQGFLVGGAEELARQLEAEGRENKERFAKLTVKLSDDVAPVYFEALLRSLVAEYDESQGVPPRDKPKLPQLASELLFPALRHAHNLPGHPCGRWICSAVGKIADRDLPDDIIESICFYVTNGIDPQIEGDSGKMYYGGDLVTYGINTTRGAAAGTLADLLFADPQRWPKIEKSVRYAMTDASWSVQAVAVNCLTALLNVDRDLAVRMFLDLAKRIPPILGSLFVENFLYRAIFSHYKSLRKLLLSMLSHKDAAARAASAQAICVASFRDKEAAMDINVVIDGDETCRSTVANLAASNLSVPEVAGRCRELLMKAFNDEVREVRDVASRCFHQITEEQLCSEGDLIDVFLNSKAFQENASILIMSLEDAVHQLPDVICKIPEKAVEIHEKAKSDANTGVDWWTHDMANLVLRLYEQTGDSKIRTRCLDVLDKMIDLDFGSVAGELAKLERA